MAWGVVYIKQEKIDELVKWLDSMGARSLNLTPVMFDIGTAIRDDTKHAIDTEGASLGQFWPQHAPATVERWGEHPLLKNAEAAKLAGMLYDRIYAFSGPHSAGAYTSDPVAILMEHGRAAGVSKAGGKKEAQKMGEMPNRDFLGITEARQDTSISWILDFVMGEGKYAVVSAA